MEQTGEIEKNRVHIKLRPDSRYIPLCSKCKERVKNIHSYNHRIVRDLNVIDAHSYFSVIYRTVRCLRCGPVVEELPLMDPNRRVSRRLADYILVRCEYMTIKKVAERFHLDTYIKAMKECYPHVQIVFDQFHVVAAFNRVIDKVRNNEYRKATEMGREVIKGSKYLLLKNKDHLSEEERPRLKALLELNETLSNAYILKDYPKKLWQHKYPQWAVKALSQWCSIAY